MVMGPARFHCTKLVNSLPFPISDFFQSFNSFIQPYQTTKRNDVVTKRPATRQFSKQRYQDAIFFETDDFIKEKEGRVDPFTTTVKPRRKKTKTTTKPSTKNPWYQDSTVRNTERSNNVNNYERTTNNYNNQAINVYDDNTQIINNNNGNNRRVDNDNYNVNDNNNAAKNYNNNRQTERPVVYNHNFNVAQKPINSRPVYNSHTTVNPLLNRPGVRPAVVDDGRPPITNKPVSYTTQRPVLSNRPNTGNDESEPSIDIGPDEDEMSETDRRRYVEIAEQSK